MRIVSVNVGQPREVETPRGIVVTSIFKEPVEGRRAVRGYNIAGDRQADLTVHGGPKKAIYAYASEHYPYWLKNLGEAGLSPGNFGENLTTEGLTEENAHIGDEFRVGTAVLRISQPRMPCAKLALRFGRADMVKRFWQSGFSGIYFSIVEEGELGAGDEIESLAEDPERVKVADVVRLFKGESEDRDLFERAMRSPLAGSWRQGIQERWA